MAVEVRLNTNESPEPPPDAFLADLARAACDLQLNRYPDREATELREALGAFHGLEASEVFCANGSNEVLQCLLLAYGGPGRSAAVFEPTYALHAHIAALTSTEVLRCGRGEHFEIEAGAALEVVQATKPDVVFVCSPNNPTGRSEDPHLVASLAAASRGLVVVDEAYAQFARWSATELLADHPNVAVVRTFSKTWALAALRIGYLLGDPEVVGACRAAALPYHLDALKQRAGIAALAYEEDMRARTARLVAERERIAAAMSRLALDVFPSDANFVLFRAHTVSATALWQGLLERSVLVRDVSSFPRLDGCLRVTVGTPAEDDRFLEALGEVLAAPSR